VTRIYTKKGDDGSTSLWYGGRVPKADTRTEAYGALDESASALGVARSLCGGESAEIATDVLDLQNGLFIAGAELATAPEASERLEDGVSRVTEAMADELDAVIDRYMERVDLPGKFVIPGGTTLSAQLDLARATIRRAERRVVSLKQEGGLRSEAVLKFLNRASDAVYAMARFADEADPALFGGREGGGQPQAASELAGEADST
jgi:cob(I)alamin adenosyltransferase